MIKSLFFLIVLFYEVFKGVQFVSGLQQFEKPRVLIPHGEIEGTLLNSRSGKKIFAFRGIPYAKAPINELRFEPPQPIEKWIGLYNATVDGAVCPQWGVNTNQYSEDCLFLNIYTGKLPMTNNYNFSRPVIIYFHGGLLESGSSHSSVVGPQYLLDKDIVLVTINYRLGFLGFLSLGNEEVPGNNGLKDQVEALRWIKQNIIYFGGDPNLITIMGSSAIYHLVSPLSKGLFHRIIAMNLFPIGQHKTITDQLEITYKVANFLNCSNFHTAILIHCLKTKSTLDIVSSYSKLAEFGIHPLIKWRPVVEQISNRNSFLIDDPFKLIQSGKYPNVPIIIGMTEHEFDYLAYDDIRNDIFLNKINQHFTIFAPIAFFYERDTDYSYELSLEIQNLYFGDSKIDEKKLLELGELYRDGITGFRTHKIAQLLNSMEKTQVYFYKFSYKGMYSNFYRTDTESFSVPIGSVFDDDIIYLFYNSQRFPLFSAKDPDSRIVDRFTTMWAYFAKTGSPTPEKDILIENVIWKTMAESNKTYIMNIHCHLQMKEELYKDKYDVWNSLIFRD